MIRTIRVLLRITALLPWTAVAIILAGSRFLQRRAPRVRKSVTNTWARGVARIIGMRMQVVGCPPQGQCFVVSNHLSYIDIIPILSHVFGFFVARGDAGNWPFIKWMLRASGSLLIDRSRRSDVSHVNNRIADVLEKGNNILLFPEATTSKGDQVYPFKSSLLALAAKRQIPAIAMTIHYETEFPDPPAYTSVCWWGGEKSLVLHLLQMITLHHINVILTFSDTPITHANRKVLTRQLHEKTQTLFTPIFIAEQT